MIVDYEIIASKSGRSVVEKIRALMDRQEGWQPQGGLAYNPLTQQYAQAVVRTDPPVSILVGRPLPGEDDE